MVGKIDERAALVLLDELGQVLLRASDDHALAVESRVDRVDRRRVRDQGIPLGAVRDHGPAQVTQLGLGLVLGVIVGLAAVRHPSCLSLQGGHRVLTLRVPAAIALTE